MQYSNRTIRSSREKQRFYYGKCVALARWPDYIIYTACAFSINIKYPQMRSVLIQSRDVHFNNKIIILGD